MRLWPYLAVRTGIARVHGAAVCHPDAAPGDLQVQRRAEPA